MDNDRLGWWLRFLDSLASDGAIFVFFMLMCFGAFWMWRGFEMVGTNIVTGAFSALLVYLTKRGSNRDQLQQPPPPSIVSAALVATPTPITQSTEGAKE